MIPARHRRFELLTYGSGERSEGTQCEALRDVAAVEAAAAANGDPGCFPALPDDSSRIVTAEHVERTEREAVPVSVADAVEVALARAIEGATAAREWAVVAQLAGELEARRRARAEVASLIDARARRGR